MRCALHQDTGLGVKPSRVAGKGLFTTRNFKKGEVFGIYVGVVRQMSEYKKQYHNDYGIEIPGRDKLVVDARLVDPEFNPLHMANDARGTEFENNMEFVYLETDQVILGLCIQDVLAGREVFVNYGDQFWNKITFTASI